MSSLSPWPRMMQYKRCAAFRTVPSLLSHDTSVTLLQQKGT